MNLIDKIRSSQDISLEELRKILETSNAQAIEYLKAQAREVAQETYGKKIFLRGLIEISSVCKNNCLYCGLRKDNASAQRYRLDEDTILECCRNGYKLGFRTFVLQGGEDPFFTDERLIPIVKRIREEFSDCAITLSLGERSTESYQRLYDAGANRYLLRHETASPLHYSQLHPLEMSWEHRMECLKNLKRIGYQVGCGFMVGSPFQTIETLYQDLQLIRTFEPHMVGIGPFIPAAGTPFENEPAGDVDRTLRLLSLIRLLHPKVLLPATTALGTLHPKGRELGIMSGANVVMPNLSPAENRKKYSIYDNKACFGAESVEGKSATDKSIEAIGYETIVSKGDFAQEHKANTDSE